MAIKKKVVTKKRVVAKKKVATKKRTVKKATSSVELTQAHKKAIAAKDKAETALTRAIESLLAAQGKIKDAKTAAAKSKANERVNSWRTKVSQANDKLKAVIAEIKEHEKTARELIIMTTAKEKAIAAFSAKWEKEYLKKLAQRKRAASVRAKAKENAKKRKLVAKAKKSD